eukprot:6484096-Amphidinium_carterae.1
MASDVCSLCKTASTLKYYANGSHLALDNAGRTHSRRLQSELSMQQTCRTFGTNCTIPNNVHNMVDVTWTISLSKCVLCE